MYQDSSRSWIKHNGGEIIYDLNRPLVPKTWNTFCYSCWENGTFQIWVNGENVKSGKYQQEMEDFELKSPILLGANSDDDDENHRFFGEISNLNIRTNPGNFEENVIEEVFNLEPADIVEWDSVKVSVEPFNEHVLVEKQSNLVSQRNENIQIWIQKNAKAYDSGFQDCENLGGNPLVSFNMDILRSWDVNDHCNYFWFPVKFINGKWRERGSDEEVDKVYLL